MIHPSPALLVRADTPISECLEVMAKHDVGSLLVISDDGKDQLVGIFTERDLLRKFAQIAADRHRDRPIRTVMTRPVRTLNFSQIDQAPQLMLKLGIRHLPVMTTDGEQPRIAGVISMRDLFRDQVAPPAEASRLPGRDKIPLVGIVSTDQTFIGLLHGISSSLSDSRAQRIERELEALFTDPVQPLHAFGLLIIDIDGLPTRAWSAALRRINRDARAPRALIVFNPLLHSAATIRIVEELARSRRFVVFTKPVNVTQLAAHYYPAGTLIQDKR